MTPFFSAIFTGKDNATFDLGRVLWAKMSIVYCAATFYALYKGHPIDYTLWAGGAGMLLAGGGGALALKAKTEPDNAP